MYGLLGEKELEALADAIELSDYGNVLKGISAIIDAGCDPYRVLLELEKIFHDKLLKSIENKDTVRYVPLVYAKILEILKAGEEKLQKGLSVKSNLESILFRAIECTKWVSLDVLLQALNNLPEDVKKNDLKI